MALDKIKEGLKVWTKLPELIPIDEEEITKTLASLNRPIFTPVSITRNAKVKKLETTDETPSTE